VINLDIQFKTRSEAFELYMHERFTKDFALTFMPVFHLPSLPFFSLTFSLFSH
jgi:hypothetical protein